MLKAYDVILQSEVSAELAARNGEFEPYRYECACCGEEVFIAAHYSIKMVPHFRHRNKNNEVECENYLGLYGVISTDSRSRISSRERAEFYFDNSSKTFSLGIRFSESEILGYEQKGADFQIRIKESDAPFRLLKINSTNFTPDGPTFIPLNHFSSSYYLSNTLNGVNRKYNLFNHVNASTFFKIQGNGNAFKAKLVRSATLFTNTQYFVALQSQSTAVHEIELLSEIEVEQTFHFETMGRTFLGIILKITHKTAFIERMLKLWGYQLDASETLTLLWPPAKVVDDVSIIKSNYAYVYSSFELQAHGNINVHPEEITKLSKGISKVFVKPKTKIFNKNTEIVIDKFASVSEDYNRIIPTEIMQNSFTVHDDGLYFLFNLSGVSQLKRGQVIFLTPESMIVRYECNYPVSYIYPIQQNELTGEELLKDILTHYKRKEVFDSANFSPIALSKVASQYIEMCLREGSINVVAKRFIEEGHL